MCLYAVKLGKFTVDSGGGDKMLAKCELAFCYFHKVLYWRAFRRFGDSVDMLLTFPPC